jgi:hypothetical protein
MPCNLVIKNSILFETAKNHLDVLADSMRELGYSVVKTGDQLSFSGNGLNGNYKNGKFNTTSYGAVLDTDTIKRSFSTNVVKKGCKQYGWDFKQLPNGKIQISKNN